VPLVCALLYVPGMRRLFALSLLLAARDASANNCSLLYPQLATFEIPLGCPLVAYLNKDAGPFTPTVEGDRNGQHWDATGEITATDALAPVFFQTIDEACVESNYYKDVPFTRYSIELVGVQFNDHLDFEGWQAVITLPDECPAAPPPNYLICTDPIQDYWACEPPPGDEDPIDPHEGHDDSVGCSTGGHTGLALLGLLFGVRRRKLRSKCMHETTRLR
jgi:MYXO-CTERM domain-containing protein